MCMFVTEGETVRWGGSTVAAVEKIIPGLSNRNSYNYCGSIRLKRQKKKIFQESECISTISEV